MSSRKALGIVGVLICLACSGTASTQTDATPPAASKARTPVLPRVVEPADFRRQFIEVAKAVRPAVVSITAVSTVEVGGQGSPFEWFFRGLPGQGRNGRKQKRQGMGSGVIVDPSGIILTNNHVVGGADELKVVLYDDRELDAEIVGTDPKTDIAVIKIKDDQDKSGLVAATLGDSTELEVGEWVMAIGSPFGLKQTVSAGIVSAIGRGNVGIADYEDFVQTDAAINPGNSGGPLVALDGRVVGVNTAIASRSGGNQGVGFAIPVNMAKAVMDQLVDHGSVVRGYLGVYIADLSKELAETFGFGGKDGVLIQDVAPGGPGAQGGLKAGDIVVSRDGKEVDDVVSFRNGIAQTPPGTKVALRVFRDGKQRDLVVQLGALPGDEDKVVQRGAPPSEKGYWGLGLSELTPELRQRFEIEQKTGVVIAQDKPDSPAARAGLRPGDLLAAVRGSAVKSLKQASQLLSQASKKKPLRLRIVREGRGMFVILK